MKLNPHFTVLVYPFRHVVSDQGRKLRLQGLDERWMPWWRRFDRNGLKRFLDDTYFFLPYVRNLLFPETTLLAEGDASQQLTTANELSRLSSERLDDELTRKEMVHGALRLTYNPEKLEIFRALTLEFKRSNGQGEVIEEFSWPFLVCWVDVALFPQNIGFLILKVRPDEQISSVEQINDFHYYLRQVHAPTIDWQLANWKRTKGEPELTFKSRDLVDFLLQGFTDSFSHPAPTMGAFLDRLNQRGSDSGYSAKAAGQVYGQAFHQYSYGCLEGLSQQDSGTTNQRSSVPAEGKSRLFASPVERALYELATCTQTSDPDYQPHPTGLKRIMEKGHIALWANWEGMALHDNVVFLGTLPTLFTTNALPHNVESDYFQLYLLTLYQKFRLSFLSGELMRRGDDLYLNLAEARKMWDDFVMFRNHYWFAEVTLKPQGTELYKRFQRGLDVLPLYESVGHEVRQLQEYYERKAEHEIEAKTNQLQQEMAKNVEATRSLQERMTEHLRIVASIQQKVEWIEIILVSVYVAHLWEMIASHVHSLEGWVWPGIVIGAALGGLGTFLYLKPWRHRSS